MRLFLPRARPKSFVRGPALCRELACVNSAEAYFGSVKALLHEANGYIVVQGALDGFVQGR
jgi:hypothetical protein